MPRPRGVAGVDRLQVGAGTEHRVGLAFGVGLEHADPHIVVGLHLVDGRLHALGDVAVDGVARLGTVERDERDAPADLVLDNLGHGPGS